MKKNCVNNIDVGDKVTVGQGTCVGTVKRVERKVVWVIYGENSRAFSYDRDKVFLYKKAPFKDDTKYVVPNTGSPVRVIGYVNDWALVIPYDADWLTQPSVICKDYLDVYREKEWVRVISLNLKRCTYRQTEQDKGVTKAGDIFQDKEGNVYRAISVHPNHSYSKGITANLENIQKG